MLLHVRPCHPGPAVVARSAGSAWRSEELISTASGGSEDEEHGARGLDL